MIVYLAGAEGYGPKIMAKYSAGTDLLFSYQYIKDETIELLKPRRVLLDSGAFTYLKKKKVNINWDSYIENYASFILSSKVQNYLELDIDNLVGLKEVERLRDKLERLTNLPSIPVWHKSRGIAKFKEICGSHGYIAIGGIVTKEIATREHPIFGNLLTIANKEGVKVHGLGYTSMGGLKKYKFYSVDSTSWLVAKYGGMCLYQNGEIKAVKSKDQRIKNWKPSAIFNFNQWKKFQQYAERNL